MSHKKILAFFLRLMPCRDSSLMHSDLLKFLHMINILKEYIKHPIRTGAIAPSSPELAKFITETANLVKANTIVEIGPGTGVLTEEIINKINGDKKFFALEINPRLAKIARERCPKAIIYQDSAANIKKYLAGENCDCVISGLPWTGFKKEQQQKILNEIYDSLEPDGEFLTFAYIHAIFLPAGRRFKKMLQEKFSQVETTKIIWDNLPPAFVYYCKK